ncbi:hypothetical protein [Hymenobacter rigui]|uniref:Uncharacterized protein n=1 Tax=Hymenobacter rigui TaxID=334424 RepID=A0A428KTQ3_9BACT|nr:hypothetical protein [Hymenobacter rigui]RSK49913.1 hypothetical protein EI291_04505 [Hymenobacter rigui]
MERANSGRSWRTSWYFALGAGWCGVLLLTLSWLVLGKPSWLHLLTDDVGWTIYPPLTALPQAWPGGDDSLRECLEAVICGSLFLAGWFRAWRLRRRNALPDGNRWFRWSLLLLLPLLVQLGGNVYAACYLRNTEEQLLQELQHSSPDSTSGAGR